MFKKIKSWFANQNAVTEELTPFQTFLVQQSSELKQVGLEWDLEGVTCKIVRSYDHLGVKTELFAIERKTLHDFDLKSMQSENAKSYVQSIRSELQFRADFSLDQAASAMDALIQLVLSPKDLDELGGESLVRASLLKVPSPWNAVDALSQARRRYKDAQATIHKERLRKVQSRVQSLSKLKLKGKILECKYIESMPVRSIPLDFEVLIEKSLDHRDLEALSHCSPNEFELAVHKVLNSTRLALVARIMVQLNELSEKIKTLPHIELLNEAEIASIVAPYYGGLNRSLKKRRAKSAMVAVEEAAREAKYQEDVNKLNVKRLEYADVAGYYPLARSMKRELVLYVGPTNSGKTWHALNDLGASDSGVYLAPLRLLALEGQEELEKRGRPTSFVTGEERDIRENAHFVSSTIEMLNLELSVDAVVVDEVQMLSDERRGWAWLAAVLGAPAKKVIMTGSPDSVELVQGLADYLGETLTIHQLKRHNELKVAPAPIRLREIKKGMAIVCFSRRDVMRIKTTIQENSEFKVAVVYGNLSPQVRREEARRFRSGEADILVATDAIAMGLNLPISEVVFYTTEKFNGEQMVELSPNEIRQIGGRAGRFGFANFGVVHALDSESLKRIRDAIYGESEMLKPPYFVAPGPNHIRIISQVLDSNSLERILTFFERAIEFSDERFARSNIDELSFLSTFVDEKIPYLDVVQRLKVACAPVAIRNDQVMHWFLNRMLPMLPHSELNELSSDDLDDLFTAANSYDGRLAKNQLDLRDAEDYLKTLTVYAWLAYRFPDVYTRIEECENGREIVNAFVERSLRRPQSELKPRSADSNRSDQSGRRKHRPKRR